MQVVLTCAQNIATFCHKCQLLREVAVVEALTHTTSHTPSATPSSPHTTPLTPVSSTGVTSPIALPSCPLQLPPSCNCLTQANGFQSYQQVSAIGLQLVCSYPPQAWHAPSPLQERTPLPSPKKKGPPTGTKRPVEGVKRPALIEIPITPYDPKNEFFFSGQKSGCPSGLQATIKRVSRGYAYQRLFAALTFRTALWLFCLFSAWSHSLH